MNNVHLSLVQELSPKWGIWTLHFSQHAPLPLFTIALSLKWQPLKSRSPPRRSSPGIFHCAVNSLHQTISAPVQEKRVLALSVLTCRALNHLFIALKKRTEVNNTSLVFSLNSNEASLWLLSCSFRNSADGAADMCCTTKENSEFGPYKLHRCFIIYSWPDPPLTGRLWRALILVVLPEALCWHA